MDRSEEYIEMCRKAKEIQKYWKEGGKGDWFYSPNLNNEGIGTICEGYNLDRHRCGCGCVWLPRQDQLQGMVKSRSLSGGRLIGLELCGFYAWYQKYRPNDLADELESFEQMWLAFVMLEKYSKFWNGKDWINPCE